MVDSKREIERKYDFPGRSATDGRTPADGPAGPGRTDLPDLIRVKGVSAVLAKGVAALDAVYYDTADLRLHADALTLRRRTGGDDAGWHLKLPVSSGVRDEIGAPLADEPPRELSALLRSRVRDAGLIPVVRLRTSRDVSHLLDADGALLAEVSVDSVRAERLTGAAPKTGTKTGGKTGPKAGAKSGAQTGVEARPVTTAWTEVEVELADGTDPAFLDAVEKKLRKAGLRPASSASKLGRALAETGGTGGTPDASTPAPSTAGDHVLAYLRTQAAAIVAQDPAARRGLPDSVHQLRVATRRLRSALRTYRKVLDRNVTDPIGDELKWLAAELGVDRDHEVLAERLSARLDAVPGTLLLGPVHARLQIWDAAGRAGSRSGTVAVLDSERYLTLLGTLDALIADPPTRPGAAGDPEKVLPAAILKTYERLVTRIDDALTLPPGAERDLALHNARKAAKRTRYAAEAGRPALGKPAKRFAGRIKALQTVLGDHQDSVVARETLRTLAVQAHAAGESAFLWGLLYGQEEAQAARRENELPEVWAAASAPELRAGLGK